MTENPTPSKESSEKLDKLSGAFNINDVKFLLALNADFSIHECTDNALGMVSRLEKYVKNGYSTNGIADKLGYGEIITL